VPDNLGSELALITPIAIDGAWRLALGRYPCLLPSLAALRFHQVSSIYEEITYQFAIRLSWCTEN